MNYLTWSSKIKDAEHHDKIKKAGTGFAYAMAALAFQLPYPIIATLTTTFLTGAGSLTAIPGRWASCGVKIANCPA